MLRDKLLRHPLRLDRAPVRTGELFVFDANEHVCDILHSR